MSNYVNHGYKYLMGMVCSLLLLSACATTVGKEVPLEERANARWDALLSGDMTAAYEYLSPAYRSSVSLMQYQRTLLTLKVQWTSAEYLGSECEEVSCKVKISLGYSVYGALPGVKEFKSFQITAESWLKLDGVWYHVPEN